MRRWVPVILFALCLVGSSSAQAAYDHASGAPGPGAGEYSASIVGKLATTDVVFVLDNSGSMANSFGASGSRWDAVSAATKTFVEQLGAGGLFARGGRVGVVLFSTSTSELAPTAEQAAIDQKINEGSAGGESCISCGLKRAAELLTAIPGSNGHRRLIYLVADGENTGVTPTIEEALAADNAAGAVRRAIGVGSGASTAGLEALDSDGVVTYPESQQALATAYSADPTSFPGATNLTWAFHLTPDHVPSAATASLGSATISGSDVTWTIPSLGAETATLTIHSSQSPTAKSCEPKGFLSGTTFSDAEGDPAPSLPPEAVPAIGCAPPRPPASTVISLPKAPAKCWRRRALTVKVTPSAGVGVEKTVIKLTGHKAKTYTGKSASGKIKVRGLPAGSYKVKVTVTLGDGTTQTLARSYRTCAAKQKS
jgi:hypothetical protein